uniref:Uncharacterized protein n=1 Tax=Aplanochytrium stocchinoi TaxID=215587 RepID=A0A7S3V280_9STRA|mmetsp:Transcript_19391/g.23587  ORF Transcript_19391/g.23587 Transcript_19391/m.23587 type:complete len:292 (-) Transcript_19391:370-1245(-)
MSFDVANFNVWAQKPFKEQAQAFLNAFWDDVQDQAEFIYTISYKTLRAADMHKKGIEYLYEYREGIDVDFVTGLYFYEKLWERVHKPEMDGTVWAEKSEFSRSMPVKMTAVERKNSLSDQDLNSDNRISFLEYLLHQYAADPEEFIRSSLEQLKSLDPNLDKAQKALVEVNSKLTEIEKQKAQLKKDAKGDGPKAKKAQFQLKSMKNSQMVSDLNARLLKAEAAIRAAQRAAKGSTAHPQGTAWWVERELQEVKELYGAAGARNKSVNGPKKHGKKADAWIKNKEPKWKVK